MWAVDLGHCDLAGVVPTASSGPPFQRALATGHPALDHQASPHTTHFQRKERPPGSGEGREPRPGQRKMPPLRPQCHPAPRPAPEER